MSKFISNKINKFKMLMVALTTAVLMSPVTQCVTIKTNLNADTVMGGVIGVVIEIAKYVGIVLAASGIFQLVIAYKDDDANGQSRAVRLVVVAVALIGLPVLLKTAGLIA